MKRLFLILLFCCVHIAIYAQDVSYGGMSWEDFVALMADETDDDTGPDSELFENLYELHNQPMNINTIDESDLHRLPFLSENDIKNIMFYVNSHRPLFSLGELMFIQSLDRQKRLMMHLFCYAGEVKEKNYSLKNVFKYARNEVSIRTDFPLYTKAGYKNGTDSLASLNPNKIYRGNKFYHSLRYSFASQEHFFVGLQMEKDPGEKYIDYIAGYAMIKNINCIQTAILGNYRLSFGQGLVLNTGTVFGKTMKLSSMDVIDKGITKHSSTSEYGFFRGGATTMRFGKIKLSAYFSYRDADGTFNSDSSGITSINSDGLHRTQLEQSKKNNIKITDFGGNIHFDYNKLQMSLTAAATHLNVPLKPKYDTPSSTYRYYNPQGYDFSAYSLAYSYRTNKVFFSGETAINQAGAIATLNQFQWTPNSYNSATIIQRYYGAKYNALNSRAFGENSSVNNEQGIYLGWESSPSSKWKINTYVDAIHFPWLRYKVNSSSYAFEFMSQVSYSPVGKHSFNLRYRYKSKQQNASDDESKLVWKVNQNIRLQHIFSLSDQLSFHSTFYTTIYSLSKEFTKGFAFSESIRYLGIKDLRIDGSLTYFNTDDYSSRIYNYESSLQYSFAMNSYYNHGFRATLLSSYKLKKSLYITAKIGSTIYLDKDVIGSSLEQIDSKHKEDIQILLRYKF